MSQQRSFRQLIWAILITLLLAGCGAPPATPDPNSRSSLETDSGMMEITFDGSGCTASGPLELQTGRHSILLKDLSEVNVDLWVAILLDGHTFQDLLDGQVEPGHYSPFPQPSWVVHSEIFVGSKLDEALGGEIHGFLLDKEGEYAMYVGGYNPNSLWFCAPVWVVEAPSG